MTGIEYYCEGCGTTHREGEGGGTGPDGDWPLYDFVAPDAYILLSERERFERAHFTGDLCIIHGPEYCLFAAKLFLAIPLRDAEGDLLYAPWVELTEEDFDDIILSSQDGDHSKEYTGLLGTTIPGYESTRSVPVHVRTHGYERPSITPDPRFDHALVRDFYEGITREEAELRWRTALLQENDL